MIPDLDFAEAYAEARIDPEIHEPSWGDVRNLCRVLQAQHHRLCAAAVEAEKAKYVEPVKRLRHAERLLSSHPFSLEDGIQYIRKTLNDALAKLEDV